jgi:uncharacterized protein (TIGR02246 family)
MNDEQQILDLMARWRSATARGDLDAVLGLMAEDALFFTAGKPPMSKQGFATGFGSLAERVKVDAEQNVREVRVSGDLAYAWTELTVTMTDGGTGEASTRSGHTLSVFRREPSGWLLARDANLLGAPAEPSAEQV